jgi:hypothetical protein
MIMMLMNKKVATTILAGSVLLPIVVSAQQQQQQYSCVYTDSIELENWGDGTVYMEYYANLQATPQTITMKITYMDGDDSWVGIGINTDDDHGMTNSWAVIGDGERGVKRYWMTSEERDASGVLELEDVHNQLKDASFIQQDGQSILEFTMDIEIKDEDEAATIDHVISPNSHWYVCLSHTFVVLICLYIFCLLYNAIYCTLWLPFFSFHYFFCFVFLPGFGV